MKRKIPILKMNTFNVSLLGGVIFNVLGLFPAMLQAEDLDHENVQTEKLGDGGTSGNSIGVNFSGNLLAATCKVQFSEDILQLEGASVSEFHAVGNVSAYSKPFTLSVKDCQLPFSQQAELQLSFSTQARTDMVAPGAFENQQRGTDGALIPTGIGLAVYDSRDDGNVLNANGTSRSLVYPAMDAGELASQRQFYVRYMQTALNTQAGPVTVILMASAIYN